LADKLNSINENAVSSFNRIKQKHGFKNVEDINPYNKKLIIKEVIGEEKFQEMQDAINISENSKKLEEVIQTDRVFDVLKFIDEQDFSNNIKVALGIILSGEKSEIKKAVEYLKKELI
jgi:hypothetical protein